MSDLLKIAIIGDFNFAYNTHHATNLSIDHASNFLEIEISYYWIKTTEAVNFKESFYDDFDGIWLAPGPFKNDFYLNIIINQLNNIDKPVLITGEFFKVLLDYFIVKFNFNPNGEKLISDNLVEFNSFEKVDVFPSSKELIRLYKGHNPQELTVSRYSVYPKLVSFLIDDYIDIEAYNQFEEIEVYSLKSKKFFVACSFLPQISSTREIPHPLIYTFITACNNLK